MDIKVLWKPYGSADVTTRYEVWSDYATPNVFVSLATNLSPHDSGAGGYSPRSSTLAAAMTALDTAMTLASGGGAIFANGDYGMIDREALLLSAESGEAYTVARAQLGTLRQAHAVGAQLFRMTEYYDHTSIDFGSRHVIRYRIYCIHSSVRFIAAEAAAIKPGTAPAVGVVGVPKHNDLCCVWGIEDALDGSPVANAPIGLSVTSGLFAPGTSETYNTVALATTSDASGYWQLEIPKDRARQGSGTLTLTVNGRAYQIATIPNGQDTAHYSECIAQ